MTELTIQIRDGIDEPDPATSISRIKEAVVRGLRGVDPTAGIRSTDYFNHTFAPDFVVSWNGGQASKRYVYLRFNEDLQALAEDVRFVANHHPIIVGLEPMPPDSEGRYEVSVSSKEASTLVIDPDALSFIEKEQGGRPIVRLLSTSLLQGGRGLIDEIASELTSRVVADGFDGAQNLASSPTAAAADLVWDVLAPAQARRLNRFLLALWVGSGGLLSAFPGQADLPGELDDAALSFLLQTHDIAQDETFWRRVIHGVTVDQLVRLPLVGYLPNLQSLVAYNVDRLWGRALRLVPTGQASLDEAGDEPSVYWTIEGDLLSLRGQSFRAYIATTVDQLERVPRLEGRGPGVPELTGRAGSRHVALGELQLTSGRRIVAYGSEGEEEDVTEDEQLRGVAASLGPQASVRRVTASLSAGRRLQIDFQTRTAQGPAGSRIPLRDLVLVSLALLHDPIPSEEEGLLHALPPSEGPSSLFG